jgi:hypothetical protein
MWVRERHKGKNKEKCINRAIIPDNNQGYKHLKWGSSMNPYPDPVNIYQQSAVSNPGDCHHGYSFSTFQSNSPHSLHSTFHFPLTKTHEDNETTMIQ